MSSNMKIVFVCLGNICRSPAAEALLRSTVSAFKKEAKFEISSRATGTWHLGMKPDDRMIRALGDVQVEVDPSKKAELLSDSDILTADYIFCADREIENEVMARQTALLHLPKGHLDSKSIPQKKAMVCLMTVYSKKNKNSDILDPFYGLDADFTHIVEMLKEACHEIALLLITKA